MSKASNVVESILIVSRAFVALVVIFVSTTSLADTNVGYVAANRDLTLEVCDGISDPNGYPRYIHYTVFGTGYSWVVNGASNQGASPIGVNLANLPAGQHCMSAQVSTSGIPNTGYPNPTGGRSIHFIGCIVYPITGPTCEGQLRQYIFVNTSGAPVPTLNPSATITTEGSRPITVTLSPPFAATTVNAQCTQVNGAQISVAPSTLQTDISGKAVFTVSTPVLNVPAPPGVPSGVCTFSLPIYGTSAQLQIHGAALNVSIFLSQQVIAIAGAPTITATTSPVVSGAPVTIDASCTSQLAQVSVSPISKVTDAQGKATFTVNAAGLVNINQNLTTKPSASCNFLVRNTTTSALLSFTTANACTFTDLQPRPAACGNPTN